jgi:hypothetical protein
VFLLGQGQGNYIMVVLKIRVVFSEAGRGWDWLKIIQCNLYPRAVCGYLTDMTLRHPTCMRYVCV